MKQQVNRIDVVEFADKVIRQLNARGIIGYTFMNITTRFGNVKVYFTCRRYVNDKLYKLTVIVMPYVIEVHETDMGRLFMHNFDVDSVVRVIERFIRRNEII